MQFREAIKLTMTHEMRQDEKVFLIGEDVGIFGGDFVRNNSRHAGRIW